MMDQNNIQPIHSFEPPASEADAVDITPVVPIFSMRDTVNPPDNSAGLAQYQSGQTQGGSTTQSGSGNSIIMTDPQQGYWIGAALFSNAPFRVDMSGNLTALSATISGNITATTGAIGGFSIGSDYIRDTANSFGMASTITVSDDVRFWAGDTFANRATAPFTVTESGILTLGTGSNKITLNGITGVISANGSAWTLGGSGTTAGIGAWTKISTITMTAVSVANTTVTAIASFTSLTGDTDDMYLMVFDFAFNADPGTGTYTGIQLNTDTTANYITLLQYLNNATLAGLQTSGDSLMKISLASANNKHNVISGSVIIKGSKTIAGTTRTIESHTCYSDIGLGSTAGTATSGGVWGDTTNEVTSVQLCAFQNSGASKTVSGKVTLYKINR